MLALIQVPKQSPLGHEAQGSYPQGRAHEGQPEAEGSSSRHPGDGEGHKGADHVKRAVGNVRDPQDAEDESKARRYDEKDDRAAQAHEDLAQYPGRTDSIDEVQAHFPLYAITGASVAPSSGKSHRSLPLNGSLRSPTFRRQCTDQFACYYRGSRRPLRWHCLRSLLLPGLASPPPVARATGASPSMARFARPP